MDDWYIIMVDSAIEDINAYSPKPNPWPIAVYIPCFWLPDSVFLITRTIDGPGDIAPNIRLIDNVIHWFIFIIF